MGPQIQDIEHSQQQFGGGGRTVPGWVPRSVQNYIDHTEMGIPIRALARKQGCHASTILRQIRRVETLRDDPLVDGVLKSLGGKPVMALVRQHSAVAQTAVASVAELPDAAQLSVDGVRVLRRLSETGAVLAVAADMERAVIVRRGRARAQASLTAQSPKQWRSKGGSQHQPARASRGIISQQLDAVRLPT